MKNKKLSTALFVVILLLQIAAEALAAAIILRLGMMPDKYVIILVAALVLLAAVVGLLLFLPRKGRQVSNTRRIIACVLALLMVCGCAVVSKVASEAYAAIHAVTTPNQPVNQQNIYILVRAEDSAQTLEDAADYRFGYMGNYDQEQTMQALTKVENTIGKLPQLTDYTTAAAAADALLGGDVDAALLNGISITLLLDEEEYEDLFDHVRILTTISYTAENENPEDTQMEDWDIVNKPFAIYVSGSDTRNAVLSTSRSDVNILVFVNPVTKQVLMVNTPRDYYVPHPHSPYGTKDKLTHLGLYGADCSIEALETLYEADVNYYAQINFTGFEKLVDAIGGVTVYSDQAFSNKKGTLRVQKGENTFNGEQALAFARERYNVSGGDNSRGKNQMKLIAAIMEKATSGTTIISNYSSILKSLSGMFTTNLSMEDVGRLVKMQLNDMATWNIQSYAVTGTGGYEKTYSIPGDTAYVMHPNEEAVEHARDLIKRVMDGEVLTAEDVNP